MTLDSKFLSTAEVAKLLGVSSQVVLKWARLGKIPVLRLGKRVLRFEAAAIEAWLKKCNEQPG
jgi:excisionase family DNA binding protein